MLRVVLVTEPDGGGSTVVGLAYTALVRLGTDREDPVRFTAPPAALDVLTSLYSALASGSFPGPISDEEVDVVQLRFSVRGAPRLIDRFRRPDVSGEGPQVDCRWVRGPLPDLVRSIGRGTPPAGWTAGPSDDVAPIFVVPMGPGAGAPGTSPSGLPAFDAGCRALLEYITPVDAGRSGPSTGRLHPVFVLARTDRLDPAGQRAAGIGPDLSQGDAPADRNRAVEFGLGRSLPRTAEFLRARESALGPPKVFVSYVHCGTAGTGGAGRPLVRAVPGHGREPEYPFGEFRALIEYLGSLVRDRP